MRCLLNRDKSLIINMKVNNRCLHGAGTMTKNNLVYKYSSIKPVKQLSIHFRLRQLLLTILFLNSHPSTMLEIKARRTRNGPQLRHQTVNYDNCWAIQIVLKARKFVKIICLSTSRYEINVRHRNLGLRIHQIWLRASTEMDSCQEVNMMILSKTTMTQSVALHHKNLPEVPLISYLRHQITISARKI